MNLSARITGIKYCPFLCRELNTFAIENLYLGLASEATFILGVNKNVSVAVSWWVSPKRTRSYPYSRVYDSLGFQGKKVTIIPVVKDEGKDGDRDFIQWDTVSLMSLLGVYTIVSYYDEAEQSTRYKQKITNQRFDTEHIKEELQNIVCYHSDALHWNIAQMDKIGEIGRKALDSYSKISQRLAVEMHSAESAEERLREILQGKEHFMDFSRNLAKMAQDRESQTVQPKENLSGSKAKLTIRNYIGGYYYFTCDECLIEKGTIFLTEGKHSKQSLIPSLDDIKDGLLKMMLFTNLEKVMLEYKAYPSIAILKLTGNKELQESLLSESQVRCLQLLKKEAETNHFKVFINGKDLNSLKTQRMTSIFEADS